MEHEHASRYVEIYNDKAGSFRWRRVASRGNLPDAIVADGSEGYDNRASARAAAERENEGYPIRELRITWGDDGAVVALPDEPPVLSRPVVPAPVAEPYSYTATVLRVVDGDTVKLSSRLRETDLPDGDLGFHVYIEDGWIVVHETIRLLGINAPDLEDPVGKRAATAWLTARLPVGQSVRIVTRKDDQEKYGRFLAKITLPSETASLNDQLFDAGLAVFYDGGKRALETA